MNHRTLARAGSLETRWKSSTMSVISSWPSSSLTRRGRTRSITGATTEDTDADLATSGFARRSAPIACDHRTTGSLSPSSSVSHATRLRAASAPYQAERRLVFPKPAGQAMRVSLRSDPLRRRSRRRSRGIDCSRTGGGRSFVATRVGCPTRSCPPPSAAESSSSEVSWRASGNTSRSDRPGARVPLRGSLAVDMPLACQFRFPWSMDQSPCLMRHSVARSEPGLLGDVRPLDGACQARQPAGCPPVGGAVPDRTQRCCRRPGRVLLSVSRTSTNPEAGGIPLGESGWQVMTLRLHECEPSI